MQNINKILKTNIEKHNLEGPLLHQKLLSLWDQIVVQFVPDAPGKTMVCALEKGVLRIASLSREIAQKIYEASKRIMYELNSQLGKNLIFSIYLEV